MRKHAWRLSSLDEVCGAEARLTCAGNPSPLFVQGIQLLKFPTLVTKGRSSNTACGIIRATFENTALPGFSGFNKTPSSSVITSRQMSRDVGNRQGFRALKF